MLFTNTTVNSSCSKHAVEGFLESDMSLSLSGGVAARRALLQRWLRRLGRTPGGCCACFFLCCLHQSASSSCPSSSAWRFLMSRPSERHSERSWATAHHGQSWPAAIVTARCSPSLHLAQGRPGPLRGTAGVHCTSFVDQRPSSLLCFLFLLGVNGTEQNIWNIPTLFRGGGPP